MALKSQAVARSVRSHEKLCDILSNSIVCSFPTKLCTVPTQIGNTAGMGRIVLEWKQLVQSFPTLRFFHSLTEKF